MLLRFHLPTLSENTEAFLMSRIENLVSNDSPSTATLQQKRALEPFSVSTAITLSYDGEKSLLAKLSAGSRDASIRPTLLSPTGQKQEWRHRGLAIVKAVTCVQVLAFRLHYQDTAAHATSISPPFFERI